MKIQKRNCNLKTTRTGRSGDESGEENGELVQENITSGEDMIEVARRISDVHYVDKFLRTRTLKYFTWEKVKHSRIHKILCA